MTAPEIEEEATLRDYYERASRANARAFVDDLLALAVSPPLTGAELSALPDRDRARLRNAVAVAAGRRKQWCRLHGSHLSGDERLLAIMCWRWTSSRQLLWYLRERRREIQEEAANTFGHMVGDADAGAPTMTLIEADRYGAATGERVAIATEAARMFPGKIDIVQTLTKQFETRTQLTTFLEGTRALSRFASGIHALNGLTGLTNVGMLSGGLVGGSSPARFMVDPPVHPELGAAKAATAALALTAPGRFMIRPPRLPDFGAAKLVRDAAAAHQLTSLVEPIRRMAGLFDTEKLVTAALAGLKAPPFPAFDAAMRLMPHADELRRLDEAMRAAEKLERRFHSRALAYIVIEMVGRCSLWDAARLSALTDAEVEEVALLALELAVCDGRYITALREELASSALVRNPRTSRQMDHLLRHAARGEWGDASDPLYAGGLEGLYSTAAITWKVITPERTFPGQRKTMTFKTLVKRLPIPQELKTLMTNNVFGGIGNTYRHGEAESGERRQVLLGVVALAGLMQACDNGCPAFTALAEEGADALPKALKLQRGALLIEGAGRPALDA